MQQGDILEQCPVFFPSQKLSLAVFPPTSPQPSPFDWERHDVIVMSQSCDRRAKDQRRSALRGLGPFDLRQYQAEERSMTQDEVNAMLEAIRRGNRPAFHMLNRCQVAGLEHEQRIVELRRVFVLPLNAVSDFAASRARVRLNPPYREHLSQAFARFFMRVGLPSDIPPFTAERE